MSPFDINYSPFDTSPMRTQSTYLQNIQSNNSNRGNGTGDALQNSELGMNIDTLRLGLGGLQTIGNIWNAWQMNKLAKDQFNFQKGITNTNLANQIQSYNTALGDRINARSHMEGRPDGYAQRYIEDNKARDYRT